MRASPSEAKHRYLHAEYEDRLLYVRYRYDEESRRRFKTVELIVDEVDWVPENRRAPGNAVVRVGWQELELRQTVKAAGGRWNPVKRVSELPHDLAQRLGLGDRIVGDGGG